jgi:hypothetical protein
MVTPAFIRVAPGLWTTFAVAWLVVLVTTMGVLSREALSPPRVVATLGCLALLALCYLWLSLRAAPTTGDHDRTELSLRTRLTVLVGMTLSIVPLVALVPTGGMWWNVMYVVVAAGLTLPVASAAIAIIALLALALATARITSGYADPRLFIQLAIGGAAMAVRHLTLTVEELRRATPAPLAGGRRSRGP